MENFDVKPLSMLSSGQSARVVELAGGKEFRQRLVRMGLNIGSEIRIVSCVNTAGPTLVASGSSRPALGRGITCCAHWELALDTLIRIQNVEME